MTTSPASMGEPLSEADRLADVREALADWMDNDDCDALLSRDTALLTLLDELEAARARVGVLEGQLAKAREELAARPKPRPRATVKVSLTKCTWCLEDRREMSEWEQKNLRGFWKRLCKPCARKRLNNGYNALLGMRKVEEDAIALGLDGGDPGE